MALSRSTPITWTPTFTGFGTVTGVTAFSWAVGPVLYFEITFACGTPTATEARISLGFNGIDGNVTSSSTYPSLQICGNGGSDSIVGSSYVALIEASKTYITLGFSSTLQASLSKLNGNVLATSSGQKISIKGSVRT